MSKVTVGEISARGDTLEEEAASILGRMLFEFSRLDVNLGLCLVWVDGGAKLESLTETVADLNLNSKLLELSSHVEAKFPKGSKRYTAYITWLNRAHKIRQKRNELVHGRWGIVPHRNKLVNVIGLPTSNTQKSIEYTIGELSAINVELRSLRQELCSLREEWPI